KSGDEDGGAGSGGASVGESSGGSDGEDPEGSSSGGGVGTGGAATGGGTGGSDSRDGLVERALQLDVAAELAVAEELCELGRAVFSVAFDLDERASQEVFRFMLQGNVLEVEP